MKLNMPKRKTILFTTLGIIIGLLTATIYYSFAGGSNDIFTISQGPYPGAPSFTIWNEDATWYAKTNYGEIDKISTSFKTVVEYAIENAPEGGTIRFDADNIREGFEITRPKITITGRITVDSTLASSISWIITTKASHNASSYLSFTDLYIQANKKAEGIVKSIGIAVGGGQRGGIIAFNRVVFQNFTNIGIQIGESGHWMVQVSCVDSWITGDLDSEDTIGLKFVYKASDIYLLRTVIRHCKDAYIESNSNVLQIQNCHFYTGLGWTAVGAVKNAIRMVGEKVRKLWIVNSYIETFNETGIIIDNSASTETMNEIRILNNWIDGNRLAQNNQSDCIDIITGSGGVEDVRIVGNTICGTSPSLRFKTVINITGTINDSSIEIHHNVKEYFYNDGTRSRNVGTATITAGQTSVDVAHELYGEPNKLYITPTDQATDWYASQNSTHITITIPSTLGSDANFAWEARREFN